MQSQAVWQLRRDIANKIFKDSSSALKKQKGGKKLTDAEVNNLRNASKNEADDLIKAQREYKADITEAEIEYGGVTKPKLTPVRRGNEVIYQDELGRVWDPVTGKPTGEVYALGGLIR